MRICTGRHQGDHTVLGKLSYLNKMLCYVYLQDESEPGAVLHLLVSNLDVFALLDGQPSQQGIQHWVHTLPNVLQQQTVSISHCTFDCIKVPGMRRRSITQLVQKVETCTEPCRMMLVNC